MTGTVILITGANRVGIGKGLVSAYLARANTTVIATVRDVSAKHSIDLGFIEKGSGSELIILSLSVDIPSTIADAILRLRTHHHIERIDLVISNAGICNHWGRLIDLDDMELHFHLETNAVGPLRLFRATSPFLERSIQPKFVYISSEVGSIARVQQSSLTTAYGVSKAAGNYLIKKIDAEHPNLIAFCVDPGFVQTDMGNRGAQLYGLLQATMTVAESVQAIVKQVGTQYH
ncbi:hypothetical protein BJY04DRAFT_219573 [Aspergillus karnatakaensis]|uniref:uncharacterized protein n=1 Tax=Aspergillus karnatakaensis TaxID=1810916 RepID=UPI003CCDCCEF